MADELNVPTHRYYKPKYNVALAKEDISPKYILDSGIRKIDARIGEVEIREPLFSNNEAGVWYDPSQAANLDWRRNLLTFTEQFDNAGWAKANSTVTANSAIAPDGTTTADTLIENTASNTHQVAQAFSVVSGNTYTKSVYAKLAAGSRRLNFAFLANGFGTEIYATFNLSTLTVATSAGVTASLVDVGDGWVRCQATATATATAATSFVVRLSATDTAGFATYTGDGTSGIYIWGAQLELGSTATEYQRVTDVNTEVMERFPEATLFQDTAGTTPVTTAGQTVGLMLDKSKGLVLGSEQGASLFADGWVTPAGVAVSGGVAIFTGAPQNTSAYNAAATVVGGKTYQISITLSSYTSGTAALLFPGGAGRGGITGVGTYTGIYYAASSGLIYLWAQGASNNTFTISSYSVRELAGNHATQATAASRPTYGIVPFGGRRNLLTFSEQFDNAIWGKFGTTATANVAIAPDNTNTADRLVQAATNTEHYVEQGGPAGAGTYRVTYRIKAETLATFRIMVVHVGQSPVTTAAIFNVNTETGEITAGSFAGGVITSTGVTTVGGGWYECHIVYTLSSAVTSHRTRLYTGAAGAYLGDGASSLLAWGAQLELGSTATAYQRVTTQYDVTEAGVPPVAYLAFDGVDDFMVTPTITPSIDKVQVFAGLRKLSDAAVGILVESSANANSNAGSFYFTTPNTTAGINLFLSRGSLLPANGAGSVAVAPVSAVMTGIGDIAGDVQVNRRNGVQVAQSTDNQGTGNYLAYPLYIGRRGGTTFPFNGQLYSLIARFGDNLSNNAITSIETYVASKTGVTL